MLAVHEDCSTWSTNDINWPWTKDLCWFYSILFLCAILSVYSSLGMGSTSADWIVYIFKLLCSSLLLYCCSYFVALFLTLLQSQHLFIALCLHPHLLNLTVNSCWGCYGNQGYTAHCILPDHRHHHPFSLTIIIIHISTAYPQLSLSFCSLILPPSTELALIYLCFFPSIGYFFRMSQTNIKDHNSTWQTCILTDQYRLHDLDHVLIGWFNFFPLFYLKGQLMKHVGIINRWYSPPQALPNLLIIRNFELVSFWRNNRRNNSWRNKSHRLQVFGACFWMCLLKQHVLEPFPHLGNPHTISALHKMLPISPNWLY